MRTARTLANKSVRFQLSPDGRLVFVAAGAQLSVLSWPELKEVTLVSLPVPASARMLSMDVSPAGDRVFLVAHAKEGQQVRHFPLLIEGADWQSIVPLEDDPQSNCRDGFFSRDGRTLLTVQGSQAVAWDVTTRTRMNTTNLPMGMGSSLFGRALALADDSESVLIPGADGRFIRWTWTTNTAVPVFERQRRVVEELSFSADGKILAGHCRDGQQFSRSRGAVIRSAWQIADGSEVPLKFESFLQAERQGFAIARYCDKDASSILFDLKSLAKQSPRPSQLLWLADAKMSLTPVLDAKMSVDAESIATIHQGKRIAIWKRISRDGRRYQPTGFLELPASRLQWSPGFPPGVPSPPRPGSPSSRLRPRCCGGFPSPRR